MIGSAKGAKTTFNFAPFAEPIACFNQQGTMPTNRPGPHLEGLNAKSARSMKPKYILPIIALVVTACTDAPGEPSPTALLATPTSEQIGLIAADVERILEPEVSDEAITSLGGGLQGFAFDFYDQLPAEENIIFSPYSIAQAFSMLYAGARGGTAEEIAAVLGFLPQGDQHPAFNRLDLQVRDQVTNPGDDAEPFELNIANSAWTQPGFSIEQAFLETLGRHYGAGIYEVDFSSDPDAAAERINDWVADETEERIPELLSPGFVKPTTRLVLANAIYFKGLWLSPFSPSQTAEADFTLLDGATATVDMMHTSGNFRYTIADGYLAASPPYRNSSTEMIVIVPDEGEFRAVEALLSPAFLSEIPLVSAKIDLSMPRWEFESKPDLKKILTAMGMPLVFSGEADLGGIAPGLFVGEAVHQADIAVDEEGTEAAAATAIGVEESGPVAAIIIDRPFIFIIRDFETGAILFMGRVLNPAQ